MSYSEAFMGTGRKQTDVEKQELLDLLEEASGLLEDAKQANTDPVTRYELQEFLTRLKPYEKLFEKEGGE